MATQATSFEPIEAAAWLQAGARSARQAAPDPYRLRALPNEDVYFYRKQIDNSRIVRQADPQERARCWKWIVTTCLGSLLLTALLWPNISGIVEGYRIEALKREQQQLINERSALELQEAQLLNPQRLEELARAQQFMAPAPGQVVYLN